MGLCTNVLFICFCYEMVEKSVCQQVREGGTSAEKSMPTVSCGEESYTIAESTFSNRQVSDIEIAGQRSVNFISTERFILLNQQPPLALQIRTNTVTLTNFEKELATVSLGGVYSSGDALVYETGLSTLGVVAATSHQSSQLQWYRVGDQLLDLVWFSYLPGQIRVLRHFNPFVAAVVDRTLYLYRSDVTNLSDIWLSHTMRLSYSIVDVAAVSEAMHWIMAVALEDTVNFYRLSLETGTLRVTEQGSIPSYGVTALSSFKNGFNSYFTANGPDAAIWRVHEDSSVERISHAIGHVAVWKPVSLATYRHDHALLADNGTNVAVYLEDQNGRFIAKSLLSKLFNQVPREASVVAEELTLVGSSIKGQTLLLPHRNGKGGVLVRFKTQLVDVPDPEMVEIEQLKQLKRKIMEKWDKQEGEAEELLSELSKIGEQELTNQTVQSWTVGTMTSDEVAFLPGSEQDTMEVESTEFAHIAWTEEDSEENLDALMRELQELATKIQDLEDHLENAVLPVESPVVVKEDQLPELIKSGLTVEGNVIAEEVRVTEMNGQKLQEWISDTFRLDHPQKIGGTKVVKAATSRSLQFETLGGIPKEDLVYADELGDVTINGEMVFEREVMIVGDVKLAPGGTVNGMNLPQHIVRVGAIPAGDVVLQEVIASDMEVDKTINDVNIILPTHSLADFDINSIQQATIDKATVSNVLKVSTINGLNVSDVIGFLTPSKKDSSGTAVSDLDVEYINGIKFPEGLVRTSETGVVNGTKHFQNLKANDLRTDWSTFLDLIGADDQNENQEESIADKRSEGDNESGQSDFENFGDNEIDGDSEDNNMVSLNAYNVEVHGSVHTMGAVNGYNLAELKEQYLSKVRPQTLPHDFGSTLTISGNLTAAIDYDTPKNDIDSVMVTGSISTTFEEGTNIVFEDPVSIQRLDTNRLISGVNFTELHNDTVYLDDLEVDIRGTKTVESGIVVRNIHVQNLNGIPLKDIITINGSYALMNSLTVNGSVLIREDLLAYDHVNEINMTVIGERVSSTHGAILVGEDVVLSEDAEVGYLVVGNSINGRNLHQFLKNAVNLDESFKITKNTTFQQQITISGNLKVKKSVNKVNASFFDSIVLLDRPARLERLTLQKTAILRHLTVEDNMKAALLDNCDTGSWEEEAVRLDEDAFIIGTVRLVDVDVQDSVVADKVNEDYFTSLVLLNTDQLFPGTVHLNDFAVSEDLQVDQYVNSAVLVEERDDTLLQNGDQVVTGSKVFMGNVTVEGSINVSHVSGWSLENIITTYTDQTLAANLSVAGDVTVFGDLNVGGSIGGVNLEEWYNRALLPIPNQTIAGSWTIAGSVAVHSDMDGSGIVQGQKLKNASSLYTAKEQDASSQYQAVCYNVSTVYQIEKHELQLLYMLDDVQGLEFSHTIQSVIDFEVLGEHYIAVTFTDLCAASIYRWDSSLGKFILLIRADLGPVHVWSTLRRYTSVIIVTHNSGISACQDGRTSGNIWEFDGSSLRHVTSMQAFHSAVSDGSPDHFFTVNSNGTMSKWTLRGNRPLHGAHYYQLPAGSYRFIPWDLGLGLAVWDGETIIVIPDDPGSPTDSITLPGASVAVTSDGALAAMSDGRSTVLVIKGPPNGQIVDRLHFPKPTNVVWLDLGAPGQLYLMFTSEHQKVHIFQYMGVSGMVEYLTLHYPSSSLVGVRPIPDYPHAVLVHGKAFRVLQPVMRGQPDLKLDFQCQLP